MPLLQPPGASTLQSGEDCFQHREKHWNNTSNDCWNPLYGDFSDSSSKKTKENNKKIIINIK